MRVRSALLGLLVLPLLLGGCETSPTTVTPARTHTSSPNPGLSIFFSSGTVRVPGLLDPHDPGVPGVCVADARWSDIKYGAPVVVTRADGRRTASAALDYGRLNSAGTVCAFGFSLGSLTADEGPFQVHVGKTERAAVSFTARQMAEGPVISFTG